MMTDKRPVIAIITICYNNLDGLQKTAESIQAQTNQRFLWDIIDGGSTDATCEFIQSIGRDKSWISEEDQGIYSAMNKGIDRLPDDFDGYVLFLNAGDVFASKDVIEKADSLIRKRDSLNEVIPGIIYGDSIEIVSEGHSFEKKARPMGALSKGMVTSHQAIFYHTDCVAELRYDETLKIAADYKFTIECFQNCQKQDREVVYADWIICKTEPGGISHNQAELGRREENIIRRDLLKQSWLDRTLITCRQKTASVIRIISPTLYASFRQYK